MILNLIRCRTSKFGTFGRLFINDVFECYTLEPFLDSQRVPLGTYQITLDVVSPKFCFRYPYKTFCNGKLPRLINVPDHEGILIHIGNFVKDTSGCILVGKRASLTRLFDSTRAFIDLYNKISDKRKIFGSLSINIESL